jgi:DNA-binding NarL/FixJ family response regulator
VAPKILILADQKARRLSHKESLARIKPESEFILVKSFSQALDAMQKVKFSLIVLDNQVCDAGRHRTRQEAIRELKEISGNLPIISIGTEREHAITAIREGADGFIPMQWLSG